MPSTNFTKAIISKRDKPRLEAIKRTLTIRAGGKAIAK